MTDAFLHCLGPPRRRCPAAGERLHLDCSPVYAHHGIANQRVKECNRIRALMDELAKFGVDTKSTRMASRSLASTTVSSPRRSCPCYDDHRVAMAFSVLASLAPGAISRRSAVSRRPGQLVG